MVQRVLLAEDDESLRGQLIDLLTARQLWLKVSGMAPRPSILV